MATTSSAPARAIGALVALLGLFIALPSSAHAATTPIAPPATPKIAAACQQAVTAAKATADQVIPISGIGRLSGCVADTSGIERVLVGWTRDADDAHARICTDPQVVDGAWNCVWDTRRLPVGRYTVRLVAIDAAGNQGSFTRAYEVHAPDATAPTVTTPNATTPDTTAPDTTTPEATAPRPSEDAAPAVSSPDPTPTPDADPVADDASPTASAEFSPTQRLVLDRIALCERGGTADTPTDSDAIVTQLDQANAVAACLEPATTQAGAVAIGLDADIPVPPTVRVTVDTQQRFDELAAVLPDAVSGVPVVLHLATDVELTQLALAAAALPAAP